MYRAAVARLLHGVPDFVVGHHIVVAAYKRQGYTPARQVVHPVLRNNVAAGIEQLNRACSLVESSYVADIVTDNQISSADPASADGVKIPAASHPVILQF